MGEAIIEKLSSVTEASFQVARSLCPREEALQLGKEDRSVLGLYYGPAARRSFQGI